MYTSYSWKWVIGGYALVKGFSLIQTTTKVFSTVDFYVKNFINLLCNDVEDGEGLTGENLYQTG